MRNARGCKSDSREALLHSAHTEDVEVLLARNELMSEIPSLNRALLSMQAALQLKKMLDQADLHITPSRLVMFSGMAGMLAAMAASVISVSILLMFVAGILAAALPFVHVWWKRKKRFDRFLEHLPDALDLMSRALSAGHAFSEAMHMVSTEMPEPIATRISQDLRRAEPWSLAEAGSGKSDATNSTPRFAHVRHGRSDSTRNRRQPR